MRLFRLLGWMALITLIVATFPARADLLAGSGDVFILNFDENGNGYISTNGTNFTPLPGNLLGDPTQAGNPLVLTYILPSLVVTGDVRIWEPGTNQTVLSDLLRFTDANGDLDGAANGDRMIYYSEADDTDLADTGFPATLVPRDFGGIDEVGPECCNGFSWQPGGPFPNDNVYNGISDVPEPASVLLFGTVVLLVSRATRKHSRA